MATAPLIAALLAALVSLADAREPAETPCAGRYVVRTATGSLLVAAATTPGDTIVLDGTNAVVDPLCGAAVVRATRTRHRWRLAASWPGCRGAARLRLRARASADCSLLRGVATGPRARRTRFEAAMSFCGDGVVDAGRGERCDDGNILDGDGCDAACGRCSGPTTFASTWDAIQTNVFVRHGCVDCHGARLTAGLDLRPPGAWARLVGVPVPDAPGLFEIAPGDRTTSLVWLKIAKATAGGYDDVPGPGMPIGLPLPPEAVEAFGRWIDAGAPETSLVAGAEALLAACGNEP